MPPVKDNRKNRYNCLCIEERDGLYSDLPNRHEKLFTFGKSGVNFARTSLQVTYLFSLVYMSSQIVFNMKRVVLYLEKVPSPDISPEAPD